MLISILTNKGVLNEDELKQNLEEYTEQIDHSKLVCLALNDLNLLD